MSFVTLMSDSADPAGRDPMIRSWLTGREALKRGELIIHGVTDQSLSLLSQSEREILHFLALRALGQQSESD